MTVSRVPLLPASRSFGAVLLGEPISAGAWRDAGLSGAYVLGGGRRVVPWTAINRTLPAGSNWTLRSRVVGSYAAVMRRWSIWAVSPSNAGTPRLTVTVPAGGTPLDPVSAPAWRSESRPLHFDEYLAAQSNTEAEASINIAAADDDARIVAYECTEYPRLSLTLSAAGSTEDDGIYPSTLATGQPLIDLPYQSIEGVSEAQANAYKSLRRHLYQFSRDASTTEAKAFAGAWADGIPLAAPVLGEKPHIGDTTVTVKARVYAATTAGGGGEVRFNTRSGGVGAATIAGIAGTTFAWYPATANPPASFSIECEDLAQPNGLQGAIFDTLMWQGQRTAGTLYVADVSVWRPPPP